MKIQILIKFKIKLITTESYKKTLIKIIINKFNIQMNQLNQNNVNN